MQLSHIITNLTLLICMIHILNDQWNKLKLLLKINNGIFNIKEDYIVLVIIILLKNNKKLLLYLIINSSISLNYNLIDLKILLDKDLKKILQELNSHVICILHIKLILKNLMNKYMKYWFKLLEHLEIQNKIDWLIIYFHKQLFFIYLFV
jgi:hypothetical protein